MSFVHLSQHRPVLFPICPGLHHVGEDVEVSRGFNLGVHRLSHRPLPRFDAALLLLREHLRGPNLFLPSRPRFLLLGLGLLGLGLQAGHALHGGATTGPVLVPEEQRLDLRGVVPLNLHPVVPGDGSTRTHRRLDHGEQLILVALDVGDDRRHLTLRPFLHGDGHPALLRAAHLERHDDDTPPQTPSSSPPPARLQLCDDFFSELDERCPTNDRSRV